MTPDDLGWVAALCGKWASAIVAGTSWVLGSPRPIDAFFNRRRAPPRRSSRAGRSRLVPSKCWDDGRKGVGAASTAAARCSAAHCARGGHGVGAVFLHEPLHRPQDRLVPGGRHRRRGLALWTTLQRLGLAKSLRRSSRTTACSPASCAGYGTGSTVYTAIPAPFLLSVHPAIRAGRTSPVLVAVDGDPRRARRGAGHPDEATMINRERLRFPPRIAAAITPSEFPRGGRDALPKARAFAAAALGALVPSPPAST